MRVSRHHPLLDEMLGKHVEVKFRSGAIIRGVLTFRSSMETGDKGDKGHYYVNETIGFSKSAVDLARAEGEITWKKIR